MYCLRLFIVVLQELPLQFTHGSGYVIIILESCVHVPNMLTTVRAKAYIKKLVKQ